MPSNAYDRTDRIRRAAILVASLDDALADAMLRELAPGETEQIFAVLERLESIDPEEQQDVLDEFRQARRRGSSEGAVEFTYSAPPGLAAPFDRRDFSVNPATALEDADIAAMADLLANEHPQIIAAALGRLGDEQGAAVFAALPPHLQSDVLERVSRLAPADEDALQVVQSQLLHEVDRRRAHRERATAGAQLVQRILTKTTPELKSSLLKQLGGSHTANDGAALPADSPPPTPPAQSVRSPSWPLRRVQAEERLGARASHPPAMAVAFDDEPAYADPVEPASTLPVADEGIRADRSHELESLSDERLLAALRQVDEETFHRALAASSDQFLKRITRQLPRIQARRLKRALRALGPLSLAELRRSQHQLLQLAAESQAAA